MRIKGLPGDEKWKLRPEVEVEVWELAMLDSECSYYDSFEVAELTDEWLDNYNKSFKSQNTYVKDWDDFALRPVEWDGDEFLPMPLTKAYTDTWISLIPYQNRLS